jgi:signal peptidase I
VTTAITLNSRYWGLPENHIVPVFIWMSWDTNGKGFKIRWDRVFTTVSGDGQPQSYLQYFLIALAFVGEYFWKKEKIKKNI